MPQHSFPTHLLPRVPRRTVVGVWLDLDKTLVRPEDAFERATVVAHCEQVPGGPELAPWYEILAKRWLDAFDAEWKGDGPSAVLAHAWGFSAHEALLGPMTEAGNTLVAPERRAARSSAMELVRPMAVEALRDTVEALPADSATKRRAADWIVKHAEGVVDAAHRVRLDPDVALPVFVPGAVQLLRWAKEHEDLRPLIDTNGDPEVQPAKMADADRREPGAFGDVPVVISGSAGIDSGKPDVEMLRRAAAETADVDVAIMVDDRHDTGVLAAERYREEGYRIVPVLFDEQGARLARRSTGLARAIAGRTIAVATSHADTAAIAESLTMGADPVAVLEHFSPNRALEIGGAGEMVGAERGPSLLG